MQPAQRAAQIRAWSDRLYDLLVEMEEANGPSVESATKLENLVRYAWDEAREAATRAEQSIPLPPPTTEELMTSG